MVALKDELPKPSLAIVARSSSAPLPEMYEAAKAALAKVAEIDECAEWRNQADALASYARQSEDKTLFDFAKRVKARATRRCGELVKKFDARPANGKKQKGVAPPLVSRRQIAEDAGLSVEQQKTAIRVANVPQKSFDAQVDSDTPPTVTALAEQGRRRRPKPDLAGRDPRDFALATQALGAVQEFSSFCTLCDWRSVCAGSSPNELAALKDHAEAIVCTLKVLRYL